MMWKTWTLAAACGTAAFVATLAGGGAAVEDNEVKRLPYAQLPLAFEPNAAGTAFVARGAGYGIAVDARGAALALGTDEEKPAIVRVTLDGARAGARPEPEQRLPGVSHYLVGRDVHTWRTNVGNFGRVRFRGVYPGVDVVYYGRQRELEYDFLLGAGVDPRVLRLRFDGARPVPTPSGELLLRTPGGTLVQRRPVAYQGDDVLEARYVVGRDGSIGFAVDGVDPARALVVDPVLSYSTYLGGSGIDDATAIAIDATGSTYITGTTWSPDFPTRQATQTSYGGTIYYYGDAFVSKINPSGTDLVYSTYFGGSGADVGFGIAVDAAGRAHVAGFTSSWDLPVTNNSFQQTLRGTGNGAFPFPGDAFLVKLAANGSSLAYSTYLGGSEKDTAFALALDASGRDWIAGFTYDYDFPTRNAITQFGHGNGDVFVTALDTSQAGAAALVYSTYLGDGCRDRGYSIALDAAGNVYVGGEMQRIAGNSCEDLEAAVWKLDPTQTGAAQILSHKKFVAAGHDGIYGLALGGIDDVYVTGTTASGFPATPGVLQPASAGGADAFVARLSTAPAVATVTWLSHLGGSGADDGRGIRVDASGNAWVVGATQGGGFPTSSATQAAYGGGASDGYLVQLNPAGTALLFGTHVGGGGGDAANALELRDDRAYVAGFSGSTDLPTTSGAYQTTSGGGYDAFIAAIGAPLPPAPTTADDIITSVTNLNLPQGLTTALTGKLQDAQTAYAAGDLATACGGLNAFVNQVQAQSGKKIAVADANALIAQAEQLKLAWGCP